MLARRSERPDELRGIQRAEGGRPIVPVHRRSAGVMDEPVQVQLEGAVALEPHDPPQAVEVARPSVRCQPHDLALVAVTREAQPLSNRRVKDAEGVREVDAAGHADAVVATDAPHRADEVAHAIDGQDGCLAERRNKKGAGHVCAMVLDVVELRA